MSKTNSILKLPIKTKILGILILSLFFTFMGNLCITYYAINEEIKIVTDAITEMYHFESKTHKDLKDMVVSEFILDDVKTYAKYLNQKIRKENFKNSPDKNSEILEILQTIELEKLRPGYMFIINNSGQVIAVEDGAEESSYEKNYDLNSRLLNSKDKGIVSAFDTILASDIPYGKCTETVHGKEFVYLYGKIEEIQAVLVEVFPEDYLSNEVSVFNKIFENFSNSTKRDILSCYRRSNKLILIVFIIIALISSVTASILSASLTNPLTDLKKATEYIGKGDLLKKIDIKTGDEIEELANNFNLMTSDLKIYIEKLKESISREKAIEEEIKLAANIQKSSLPESEGHFQEGKNADLYAFIKPSKIVSGDFYDYFFLDDDNLFFAIGDVSGKSIPAALFMMTTKILMKRFALTNNKSEEILKSVNDTLAMDNPTCMYSTVFCGILNVRTGHLDYCNGGHTYPIFFDGSNFEYIDVEENMLVGLTSEAEFKPQSINLKKNDILFLYSDGVTEAQNKDGEIYSEERLKEKLNSFKKENSGTIIKSVESDLMAFSENADQYDDITMLSIRRI